jgi:uncharacterized protein YdeI (YjbR/CyaY-like superfamily)
MDSVIFFENQGVFRAWLEQNHMSAIELWVGFHKTHTGLPSITWPQSVDEALCFGWIDGLRKSLGESSYMIRFTPRKSTSKWSAVNLRRIDELMAEGRVMSAGLEVWGLRRVEDAGYTYEGLAVPLGEVEEAEFRANQQAWAYFRSQSPSYQRLTCGWVMRAKRPETKAKRLKTLIEDSAASRKLGLATKYDLRYRGE